MANAWCINAIWFDWSLIRTLQNLDSSNIWVWVQFIAPNPLDDKRFDYIKYTDKCWNTCCLTWENEILIYATNWTIKNLTLTNDDTNQVVNVKRTDVFWSNRKKTVVRYKTGSAPVSITDWTLAIEELVQNQYASTWFNVSWLSDWTTYYFSAFAVAQDDTIIVVQNSSIQTSFEWKPDSHTILYWKLESNANDYSWNWRNWTASNISYETIWWIQVSKFTRNSTNIYRDWTEISNIKWTAPFSYAFRFKLNSLPSSSSYTYSIWRVWKNWYNEFDKCVMFQNNGALHCYNYTSTEHWFTSSAWTVQTNKRYCLVYTYDWTTMKVYLNNALLWQSPAPWSYPYTSTWWWRLLLWRIYTGSQWFDWNISKFALQDIWRTQSEASDFYNKTKSKYWY